MRSIDDPAAHVELDENSYASDEEVSYYRKHGLTVEPTVQEREEIVENDPDDRVTDQTLQSENRVRSHVGGSRSKRKRTEVRPLSPEERMDRRCRILRDTGADAFLPETEVECEARLVREALRKEARRSNPQGGRPRKGVQFRERYSVRLEPDVVALIKETTALDLAAFIEEQAATLYANRSA